MKSKIRYPDNIYDEFEIEEKEILGVKHYCAVEIVKILFWKIRIRRHLYFHSGTISKVRDKGYTQTWHDSELKIEKAIEMHRRYQEMKYYDKRVS